MPFVATNSATVADFGTAVDVTVDVGSSANRKAIAIAGHQNVAAATLGSVSRDPTGTPDAMTRAESSTILNSGDAFYVTELFYLDLSVTGSQTFRYDAGANSFRSALVIIVWDDLVSGGAEATSAATNTSSATISDSVTTITNNAVVFGGAISAAQSATAPTWSPNNEQTERADLAVTLAQWAAGDIVVPTAGSQTFGWTNDVSQDVLASTLAAFAPVAAPPPPETPTHAFTISRALG